MSITTDRTLTLLQKGLDALSTRQSVISHNLANIETPNFKASNVSFESSLRQMMGQGTKMPMARTNARHFARGGPQTTLTDLSTQVVQRNQTSLRKDGNNVDVEVEMANLAETAIRFQALTSLASKKLALLRAVTQETR